MSDTKKVLLVTGHYLLSKRRAGFHALAEAFWQKGWQVLFFTGALSRLSRLRRDYRLQYPVLAEANRIRPVKDRMDSFVWYTPWHPASVRMRWLERLTYRWFARYGRQDIGPSRAFVEEADLIIFESTPALLLTEAFKEINPRARYVYRVSDDMRLLGNHRVVLDAQDRLAGTFDLISVPSEPLLEKFRQYPQTRLHLHGINKDVFDAPHENPYDPAWEANCLFVGASRLDYAVLAAAAGQFKRWAFHVIGPFRNLPRAANIIAHGEMEFLKTVPYIRHADIGLHTLAHVPGAECFTNSLKVMQYCYCRLPIVAPEFLRTPRRNMFYYRPGDAESIAHALRQARAFDRAAYTRDDILSWTDLASLLAGETTSAATPR
ncbi:MAG: glucuronosyltransferase [Planctomycetaceae bacterium]|nr:hypothetical protein [Planctomycetaceae bacterium]